MGAKKSKSKEWYTIMSPKIFGRKAIGKTMVSDPDLLVGRKINVSAVEVTNNFSKYYMKFNFKVASVDGDKVSTNFGGSECMRDYVSRMVVRHVRRIDTVQDLKTKDGVKVRVKGLAVVSRRAKSNTLKQIRRRINELVAEAVQVSKMEDIVAGVLNDKLKGHVLREIRTIYPVRNFEIRKTEITQ